MRWSVAKVQIRHFDQTNLDGMSVGSSLRRSFPVAREQPSAEGQTRPKQGQEAKGKVVDSSAVAGPITLRKV
jgi:hypothetical protein